MIHLPIRRFLLPALVFLLLIGIYRSTAPRLGAIPSFIIHQQSETLQGTRVSIGPTTDSKSTPVTDDSLQKPLEAGVPSDVEDAHYHLWHSSANDAYSQSIQTSPSLAVLWSCTRQPNRHTHHVRLPNLVQNISLIPPNAKAPETRKFWNPTIFALPPWSANPYLLVSRVLTEGMHQDNVICEAYTCYGPAGKRSTASGEQACSQDDLNLLGPAGGLRCATAPTHVNVPPTPAKQCEGKHQDYADIPGFHDPRIFWSGRGEPLMMINSHSRYACFGLWVTDLRPLYEPLNQLLSNITAFSFSPSSPMQPTTPLLPYHPSPLTSYPFVTEITRTPASSRHTMEKNWFLFFPSPFESYVHYDMADPWSLTRGRTFAKLLGAGLTTSNLTDRTEISCFLSSSTDKGDGAVDGGEWHQATNSLRLILCARDDYSCIPRSENTVLFAIVHRKKYNSLGLPIRYERHAMVWSSSPPFSMIGISQHPLLLADEMAPGWSEEQNWDGSKGNDLFMHTLRKSNAPNATKAEQLPEKETHRRADAKNTTPPWQGFTYTVSIAWAFRDSDSEHSGKSSTKTGGEKGKGKVLGSMQTGYWDDELILGIGVKDVGQAFGRVKASDLVQCLRACPRAGESEE